MKKMISRRNFLKVCAVAGSAVALSACGGSKKAAAPDPSNTDQTSFDIVGGQSALSPGYNDNEVLKKLADNVGVKLNYETMSDSLSEQVNIRIAGDQLPDAFMGVGFSNYDIANYGADGTFLDLTPYINAEIMPNLTKILDGQAHDGQPIFEPLTGGERSENPALAAEPELFYCKGPDANGIGEYTTEGFVVHKGSTARQAMVASIKDTSNERFRDQLVAEGVLQAQGKSYLFTRDFLFSSPSMAAITVLGRSANGWLEWKTRHGQTLDGLRRQPTDANHLTPLKPLAP